MKGIHMCREARAKNCKILCWVKTGSFHMGIFFHNHKHPESITGPFNSEIVGGRCSSPVEPLLSTRRKPRFNFYYGKNE